MSETSIRIGDAPESLRAEPVDLLAPPTAEETKSESPLEGLRKALATPVVVEPVTLRVPARPGVTLRFRPDIDDDKRKAWQKRATKKRRGPGGAEETDELMFAMLVVANTNVAVCFNGVDAHDEEDTPLTFAHRQLWDMVEARNPQECIRKLWANDPHILLASGEILMAAGFDDDLEAEDPTSA